MKKHITRSLLLLMFWFGSFTWLWAAHPQKNTARQYHTQKFATFVKTVN